RPVSRGGDGRCCRATDACRAIRPGAVRGEGTRICREPRDRAHRRRALPPHRTAPQVMRGWPGAAWLPVALGEAGVDWAHFAGAKPDLPFFEDSVRAAMPRPFNRLFRVRTPLDAFLARAPAPLPMPSGLIFHM